MEYRSKQMLIVRRDLKMRKGKIAAQASHAAVEAVLKAILNEGRAGQLRTTPEGWVYLDAPALIRDAGMTEFHGQPTYTALAFEPLAAERADELTGGLPLY